MSIPGQMNFSPLTVLQMIAMKYRTSDENAERDLKDVVTNFLEVKNNENAQRDDALSMLRKGKEDLLDIKRELSENAKQQTQLYEVMKKRIHKQEEMMVAEQQQKTEYMMTSDLIQYVLSHGQTAYAHKLAKGLNNQALYLPEINLIEQAIRISAQIKDNNLRPINLWIQDNQHMLKKIQNSLRFDITCCQYINYINMGEWKTAYTILREELQGWHFSAQEHAIIQQLTYYLVDQTTNPPKLYIFLLRLYKSFRKSFAQIYCITFQNVLPIKLAIGFSALNTICCCDQKKQNTSVCPMCSFNAEVINRRIPMLTKEGSNLKCRVNGSIMDNQNYPVVLPSKHIYSISALTATQTAEQYYCQLTDTYYKKSEAKKVFLA